MSGIGETLKNSEQLELLLEEYRNVSIVKTRDSTEIQISTTDFLSTWLNHKNNNTIAAQDSKGVQRFIFLNMSTNSAPGMPRDRDKLV